VFHPKITILRYVPTQSAVDEGADRDTVLYRVLCSSRNLTFDRSWDTMLVLDGKLSQGRKNAYARNRPLARFVRELPRLVLHEAAPARLAHVGTIADELLRVEFEIPEGFDDLEFCPLGIEGGTSWPVLGYARMLVMAPFVGDEFVRRVAKDGGQYHLISRHESLDELSERSLSALTASYYMNTAADAADAALLDDEACPTETNVEPIASKALADNEVTVEPSVQLSGLHAKLFIADDGWNAHLWTGSANATPAAFESNVEFLVRLTGKKSRCGVSTFIESGSDTGENGGAPTDRVVRFSDFLLRYERSGPPIIDAQLRQLEDALDRARAIVVASRIAGTIQPGDAQPDRFQLQLAFPGGATGAWPKSVMVECSPITIREGYKPLRPPLGSEVVTFAPLSFEALTSFIGFRLTARESGRELHCGFVLNVPTTGMPSDREGRMLLSLLRNREQLLRYLLMLLADDEEAAARAADILETNQVGDRAGDQNGGFGLPLLEPLLQTLDRQPARLEQIARLIDDLQATPEGRLLVTEDFLQIWRPIWATVVASRGNARNE